jgi:hypothetical protein
VNVGAFDRAEVGAVRCEKSLAGGSEAHSVQLVGALPRISAVHPAVARSSWNGPGNQFDPRTFPDMWTLEEAGRAIPCSNRSMTSDLYRRLPRKSCLSVHSLVECLGETRGSWQFELQIVDIPPSDTIADERPNVHRAIILFATGAVQPDTSPEIQGQSPNCFGNMRYRVSDVVREAHSRSRMSTSRAELV